MLRCESLLGLDQATCSRVLNKNYKLLVSMAPLSNEIRPISSCTPQVRRLEAEQRGDTVDVGSQGCVCVLLHVCLSLFGCPLAVCTHTAVICVSVCVCALWALGLQLPPTTRLHKEREGGRLMSNSSIWPQSSFLAELREAEGRKLNSCCAIHAAVYSHTAATQSSGIL